MQSLMQPAPSSVFRHDLQPRNLAHATDERRSWDGEFAIAKTVARCDPSCALANPHTWQRLELPVTGTCELDHIALRRDVVEDAPRRPYHRRKDEVKSTVHWGQRKLLLSELEFLTEHHEGAAVVIYAGAAPGGHLTLLCKLFPNLRFEAYDPRPFDRALTGRGSPSNLRVHQECFTHVHAELIARRGSPCLFISDIRTADWQQQEEDLHDATLMADMAAQRKWVERIRPKWAMLKFRLPYTDGVTEYFAGEVRLPIWGPQTTTECRLIVAGDQSSLPLTRYDHRQMLEKLFYFNTVARVSIYPRPKVLGKCSADAPPDHTDSDLLLLDMGLCRCFDCSREIEILLAYFAAFEPQACADGPLALATALCNLSGELSQACGRGTRGLTDVLPPPWLAPTRVSLSPDTCKRRRTEGDGGSGPVKPGRCRT